MLVLSLPAMYLGLRICGSREGGTRGGGHVSALDGDSIFIAVHKSTWLECSRYTQCQMKPHCTMITTIKIFHLALKNVGRTEGHIQYSSNRVHPQGNMETKEI